MIGAFDNERLIGLAYTSEVKGFQHLAEIIVHPDYRGKRGERSVGKQLFETMTAILDTLSPTQETTLEVDKRNFKARSMYEQFQYAKDPDYPDKDFDLMTRQPYANITDPIGDNPYHAQVLESQRVQPIHLPDQSPQ